MPRRKPGSIAPPTSGAEPWVPAFAGTAGLEATAWPSRKPASPASNAARSRLAGPGGARAAAPGTALSRKCRAPRRRKASAPRPGTRARSRGLDFVALRGDTAGPPRRADRHRRTRPGLRRRSRARLDDPGRRRSRHRQIDAAAAGRRLARGAWRRGRLHHRRGGDRSGAAARRAARGRRHAGAARLGEQRARHHRRARQRARPRCRRRRLDPDDVSRHARQLARHGQPGARRGAGADRPRQAPRHRRSCWSATSRRRG